jgi:hypothetical protein
MGPVSAFTSINSKYSQEYNSRCGVVDCAGCPPVAYDPNNPVFYYVATCRKSGNLSAGKCEVYDLRDVNSAVTACKTEMDCTLRSGTGCCPGCGSQPVAININQEPALESLVCGTEPSACLDCAPTFTGYGTSCSGGRCSVQLTPCTIEHPCPL